PIGSRALSMSTAELVSKRMYEPSVRPISFAVRTITAFITSPFFTLAFGMASFTDTTMTSPIEAYFRRVPPSTLMQRTLRAPLLSATSRTVSAWIIARSHVHSGLDEGLVGALLAAEDDLHRPALVVRQGARLDDAHAVADLALVLLVVRLVA